MSSRACTRCTPSSHSAHSWDDAFDSHLLVALTSRVISYFNGMQFVEDCVRMTEAFLCKSNEVETIPNVMASQLHMPCHGHNGMQSNYKWQRGRSRERAVQITHTTEHRPIGDGIGSDISSKLR